MKYFFDTEFLEGPQKTWFGKTKPTIDLISIGIVEEDKDSFSKRIGKTDRTYRGREYYAISKDFNLKEAWNRFQMKEVYGDMRNRYPDGVKEYWIRENVLKPIFDELLKKYSQEYKKALRIGICIGTIIKEDFSYKLLKFLIKKYGKSNKQIAKEVRNFVMTEKINSGGQILLGDFYPNDTPKPEFYAYYADYDWVVFCWLFGSMINLPNGFPMYCRDLKQMLDEKAMNQENKYKDMSRLDAWVQDVKNHPDYPKQTNKHNALDDARWNYKLYKFLNNLSNE
jgi:hypothetical protein